MPTLKICTKCLVSKELSLFNRASNIKCGYRPECRDCQKKTSNKYLSQALIKEVKKQRQLEFKEQHPDYHSTYSKKWNKDNKDRLKIASIKYRLKNKAKIKLLNKSYFYEHYYSDINFKLKCVLRNRIRESFNKTKYKLGSAVKDLGCTVQHLKLHLELFWDQGMSWDNYGNKEGQWSIDHIKPLSSFDLTDRSQFLEACHYTNLQPLWHVDNMCKSDRIL